MLWLAMIFLFWPFLIHFKSDLDYIKSKSGLLPSSVLVGKAKLNTKLGPHPPPTTHNKLFERFYCHIKKKQAGAVLGQAQLKLEMDFTSINLH